MTGGFAGTGRLIRLVLRLDRIKLTLWVIGIGFVIAITPLSIRSITESEAEVQGITPEQVLARDAALTESSGVAAALQGPYDALDTFGGRYAFEIGAFTFAIIGLMNVLLVGRHTRAEEQSGRAELVRSAAVGPWSSVAAVGVVAVLANAVLAAVTTVTFVGDGLATGPSILFGASIGACGLVFAATALVAVQVFEYGRAATGASIAAIALAYGIRAIGDGQDSALSLLSPIGWSQGVNAFGDAAPWLLLVSLAATAGAVLVAVALVRRRDVGRGLIEQRPGPPVAAASLLSPLGLAWRLQRSSLRWWAIGLALFGGMYGSVISLLDDFAAENETMMEALEAMGVEPGAIREGFITILLSMMAIVAAGGVIQSVLRPRGEESAGYAEPVLATAIGRRPWLGSNLVLTALAAPAFMIAAGAAMSATDAMVSGETAGLGSTIGAALLRVPALWAIAGIGVALYGLAHRLAVGVWLVLATTVIVFFFGEVLRLPDLVRGLSPIRHVTHSPSDTQSWLSVAALTMIGGAGATAGIHLFGRRDVTS